MKQNFMPTEIERKYLIKDPSFLHTLKDGCPIIQGYISLDENRIVRVRTKGEKAFVTIKSKVTQVTRNEFEYEIPYAEALDILNKICLKPLIYKTRYKVFENGLTWEIDIFKEKFKGIVIAEVELEAESVHITLPQWVGKEVTDDKQYYNAEMVRRNALSELKCTSTTLSDHLK